MYDLQPRALARISHPCDPNVRSKAIPDAVLFAARALLLVGIPSYYIVDLAGISIDLRLVKPYTTERARARRVQRCMVLLCADQKKSLSGAILRSVFNEPGIPIKRTVPVPW